MVDFFILLIPISMLGFFICGIGGFIAMARKKPGKKWGIGLLVSIAAFCVSACVSAFSVGMSEDADPVSTPEPTVEPAPEPEPEPTQVPVPIVIDTPTAELDFDAMYNEFESNELRAEDTYNGNTYLVSGEICGMETGGLLNLTGGATLTLQRKVGNTTVIFFAEFEKEQEEALKQVNDGDTITFIGTCYGGNFTDCELR